MEHRLRNVGHILADKEIMEEALTNGNVTIELVSE